MRTIFLVIIVFGLGFVVGQNWPLEDNQEELAVSKAGNSEAAPESGAISESSKASTRYTETNQEPATSSASAGASLYNNDNDSKSTAIDEDGDVQVSEFKDIYPIYASNNFEKFAKSGTYRNVVSKIETENGISAWGVERENTLSDLFNARNKNIEITQTSCKVTVCLVRGIADSKEELLQISEEYQEIQEWGQQLSFKPLPDGRLAFYLATYRQDAP